MEQSVVMLVDEWLKKARKPLLVIQGATASGKTALAVELAKRFDGEVINADSRQIYEEIKIGNALPTDEERQGIPHHLFSCIPLERSLSVAEYQKLCFRTIEDILHRKKLPILCGGTMLWIDAVVDNFLIPAGEPDKDFRKKLEDLDIDELLSRLNSVDPESAISLMKSKNKRYIIRALEIYHLTGKKKSQLAKKRRRRFEVLKIAPEVEREALYERINKRTQRQLENGLIEEVQGIIDRHAGGSPAKLQKLDLPALTSIGVKEVVPYLLKGISREELLAKLQQHNRNYAKRQLTWLKKDKEIRWI